MDMSMLLQFDSVRKGENSRRATSMQYLSDCTLKILPGPIDGDQFLDGLGLDE